MRRIFSCTPNACDDLDKALHLKRITLPALAYGASLSGTTPKVVTNPPRSSSLEVESVTTSFERKELQMCSHPSAPFRPGLALELMSPSRREPCTVSSRWTSASRSCRRVPVGSAIQATMGRHSGASNAEMHPPLRTLHVDTTAMHSKHNHPVTLACP